MARVSDVMVAFIAGKKCKRGEHRTDGQSYWYRDNEIIKRDKRTFIVDCCTWPTPTTFGLLNQITSVSGRQTRGHWDSWTNRGYTLYEDIKLCGKPWDANAHKLRMDEVYIYPGLR